jgi:predicted nuclease of predicted toxin-antitoxin system
VKLLFDANLSRRIAPLVKDLFAGSLHVSQLGLAGATPDTAIWEFAKRNHFTIVTADSDFLRLAELHGAPPKVIQLARMNYSTETAANLIRRNAIVIAEFEESPRATLILRMPG